MNTLAIKTGHRSCRRLVLPLALAAALSTGGCVPSAETSAALADLAAGAAGSIVEIFVRAGLSHDLATGENVDPDVPLAEQHH